MTHTTLTLEIQDHVVQELMAKVNAEAEEAFKAGKALKWRFAEPERHESEDHRYLLTLKAEYEWVDADSPNFHDWIIIRPSKEDPK